MKSNKLLFVLALAFLLSAFCLTAFADLPILDDDELEIDIPEENKRYVASVTINATGDGLEIGEYQLLTSDTELVGLYYIAKDTNGTDKQLRYSYGSLKERQDLGNIDTLPHTKGDYQMLRLDNSANWIAGTWTGNGLTNSIRDFSITVTNRYKLPYNNVAGSMAEKLYVYSNDKETILNQYAQNFGTDSSVYKLIEGYYGTLDADGIAAALASVQSDIKADFESTLVRYAYEKEEIVPVKELKTFSFSSYKRQGAITSTENMLAKATFYVVNENGELSTHTWTSAPFVIKSGSQMIVHDIDVQSVITNKNGWVIGVELKPFADIGDKTKLVPTADKITSTTQNLRFNDCHLMTNFNPSKYIISLPEKSIPELVMSIDNKLSSLDDGESYEYAKYSFNTELAYQPLDEVTLTEGVWAVRKMADSEYSASKPQYFYVEGSEAGSVVFATDKTTTDFTEGRWTSTLNSAELFDFTHAWGGSAPAYSTTSIEIYSLLSPSYFEGDVYKTYGYRYQFKDSEIIPVSTLNNFTVTPKNVATYYYLDAQGVEQKATKGRSLTRVYVVGADVPYYDVLTSANYTGNFGANLSELANKAGYVVAIEYFPIFEIHNADGIPVEEPYIKENTSHGIRFAPLTIVDETITLNTSGYGHIGIDANGNHKYRLILATKADTPTLTVGLSNGKYVINITNANQTLSYKYRTQNSGWTLLNKGVTSFTVDSADTYYVKAVGSGTLLSSAEASVEIKGVAETPNIPLDNNTITAPDGATYQYAKFNFNTTPDWQPLTNATLTTGVWMVKQLGENGFFDSTPQYFYIMGDDVGTINFAVASGTAFKKGRWTGTTGSANLFDWDYYTNNDKKFTDTGIEIYVGTTAAMFSDGTYTNYGYRYIFEDNEIVPLEDLVDISAKIKNSSDIKSNGTVIDYVNTRARVHIAGGDVDYYDIITPSFIKRSSSSHKFEFNLSSLNDKKGYVVAIELYLFHEFTDENGNVITENITSSGTSYGITFANLILHSDVTLANLNSNNTGLSVDGKNRYSLTIANDPRAPKFEALENNPNGLRITNYVEGAKYAWSASLSGEWTEFEGDTVEFTAFGSYYIKLVGDEKYPELINQKPFTTADVVLEGTSLVLDGAIGIKVYFGVADGVDYTASYKVVDKETAKTVYSDEGEVIRSTEGNLYFVVPVYPKDVDKHEVYVTVKDNTSGATHTAKTSVPYYIEVLKQMAENGDTACIEALGVVEALETYTNYAKNYFYYAETALPDITADLDAINATKAPTVPADSALSGAEYFGTSLVLDGVITLRHYFKVTDSDAFSQYTAYYNEEKLEKNILGDTIVYYDIADIPAHKLDTKYTLELYGADNAVHAKVVYSVTNYIQTKITDNNTRLVNLMKSMYNYYKESDDYSVVAQNAGQRAEIWEAMTLAKNTTPVWKEVPEYNSTKAGYTHIKAITYDGFEYKGKKTKIFAYVGYPEGASKDNPVPAIVLVHGGGGHAYMGWVKLWNDRGYAAIAMETTGYYPSGAGTVCYTEGDNSTFVYGLTEDFAEEGYGDAPSRSYPTSYTPVEDQWAYHGLSQVILAGNILRADERVDSDNIGITGVSWGGTMVSQVIGYDNRYSFAIPVYGTAYLSTEMHTFSNFDNEYVNSLWAAERNLDNADMPTFWFAYNDDNNFCVPAYYKSYMHTAGLNDKNTLLMLGNWSHSHGSVWNKEHSFWYADWITYGKGGFITFEDQPKSANVNCKLNIPEGITGDITAKVIYITEPMSYSKFDKFGWGSYIFLTQSWQTNTTCLTVDKESATVSGTVPSDAAGYYINIVYTLNGKTCESSSIYIPLTNS